MDDEEKEYADPEEMTSHLCIDILYTLTRIWAGMDGIARTHGRAIRSKQGRQHNTTHAFFCSVVGVVVTYTVKVRNDGSRICDALVRSNLI